MHKRLSRNIVTLVGMMTLSIVSPIYAESAPVYDADALQQQFDNAGSEQTQDYLPPPPPEQEAAFVPANQLPAASANVPATATMSIEQRMRRVEQQLHNLQTNDTAARMDSLQTQVQNLRGQVEQLTHENQQLEAQLKTQYADLDKRVTQQASNQQAAMASDLGMPYTTAGKDATTPNNKVTPKNNKDNPKPAMVETTQVASVTPAAETKPAANQPDVAEEQQIYQTAYNMIKSKKYDDAVNTLQSMLEKYPSGQFASNAHYWLGELYGLLGKHDEALTQFSTVVKTYPDSPRISDAQLKVGLIYAAQSKWNDAKSAFRKVVSKYPGTASSRLAAEQLKQIRQAGH